MKSPIRLLGFFLLSFIICQSNAQTISYSSLYDNSTFSKTIDLSKPVGSIDGVAGTSPSGAATYTIPIKCPPGTNGMIPSLSVIYNSLGGNGILGQGWNLSGLSAITRSGKDMYHDGQVSPISYTNNDVFVLDGTFLVPVTGTNGEDGTTYKTESETFSVTTSFGSGSPQYFNVVSKDGTIMQYGNSSDSRIMSDDGTKVMMWRLNKILDVNGNYIWFTYTNADRDSRISQIKYTGNDGMGLAPYNEINFQYAIRSDNNTIYDGGYSLQSKYLLWQIQIKDATDIFKTYQFYYGKNASSNSYLKYVEEFAGDGSKLNDTRFQYGQEVNSISVAESNIELPEHLSHPTSGYGYDYFEGLSSGDFDGDGINEIYVNAVRSEIPYYPTTSPESDISFKVYKSGGYGSTTYSSYTLTSYKMYHDIRTVPIMAGANRLLLPYDYNGDGKDDIYLYKINRSELDKRTIYYSNSTSSLSFNPYDIDPIVNPSPYTSGKKTTTNCNIHGDFDGDKVMDFITIIQDASGNNLATISFPNKGWYNMYLANSTYPFTPSAIQASLISNPDMVMVIDFNGDGKSDLLTYTKSSQTINIYSFKELVYGKYSIDLLSSISSIDCDEIIPGDYNGDGKTDLVYYKKASSTTVRMLYSNGKDLWSDITSIAFSPDCGSEVGDRMYTADFNGDGKSDILVLKRDCSSYLTHSYFNVYYSKSLGHFDYQSIELMDAPDNNVSPLITDVNGDGLSDFVYKSVSSRKLKIVSFFDRPKSQLLQKVTDGFNRTTEFSYDPLSKSTGTGDFYVKGGGATYPINNVQFPISVVTSMKSINGVGGVNTTNYQYGNLRFYRRSGRGLLGFQTVIKIDPTNDLKIVSKYDFSIYYVPYLKENATFVNSSGVQLSSSKNTFVFTPVGPTIHCFDPKNTKVEEEDFLQGVSKVTDITFDAYGNITNSTTTITGGETFTSSNVSTYIAAISSVSIPNKPSSIITTNKRGSSLALANKSTMTYDSKGRLISLSKSPDPYVYLYNFSIQDFEYDNYGNVKKKQNKTIPGIIPASLWPYAEYLYDARGQFVIEETNTLGDKSSMTYHKFFAKPLSITGFDGLTATNTYNNWGKLSSSTVPTSLSTSYTINYSDDWDISGNQLFYTFTQDPSAPDVKTWFDNLGRPIKTKKESFGGLWTEALTTYDTKGNMASSTNNYLTTETPIITTNTYDYLNRISSTANVFGTTSFTYTSSAGLSTTTMTLPDGKVKKTTVDALGKLVKSSNGIAGTVHYTYDSRGNEISTALGTETMGYHTLIQKEYDLLGRLKKLIDPDAGTTTYNYNPFGQLVLQIDPKGKSTSFQYDIMGRVTQKTVDATYTTIYSYFDRTKEYKIERMTLTSPEGTFVDEFDYEAGKGLISQIKNSNGTVLSKYFSYDNYNRLLNTDYPISLPPPFSGVGATTGSGLRLRNHYDINGFLKKITTNFVGPSSTLEKTLYEATAMNGMEQLTNYRRVDGLNATNSYYNGIITNYSTPGIQDLSMSYNYANGNMIFRLDNITQTKEDFEYDAIDRLTKSSAQKLGATGMIHVPLEITYQNGFWGSFGQISSKSDVGIYKYGGFPRNAVKSVSDPASLISHQTQNIIYNPFQKTQKITEKIGTVDYEEAIAYDGMEDRAYSVQTQGGTISRQRWYMGDYERQKTATTDCYLHYIYSDAGLVGIVKAEGGSFQYYAAYTDHLGSIVTLTDDAGTVIAKQNYDPWGRERNPDTWGYAASFAAVGTTPIPPEWLYRGFTGHEMLPEYGLINMNGRIYDPMNGRMMRPDNFVQDPTNSQSYNRYSYCWNNPMKYTDPSGEMLAIPLMVLGFLAESTENLIYGRSDPFGKAWRSANQTVSEAGTAARFPIYQNSNSSLTIGADPFNVGVSIDYARKDGDLTSHIGAGIGILGPSANIGASYNSGNWTVSGSFGTNFNTYSAGGGLAFNDGKFSAGYYQTFYGGDDKNQWSGGVSLGYKGTSIRVENDFLAFGHSSDKFRTNAIELGIGNYTIGSWIYTNDGEKASGGKNGVSNQRSPIWGENFSKKGFKAWNNGQVFGSPLYIGYRYGNRVSRIGISAPWVQDFQQNGMHQSNFTPGNQNYYLNYQHFNSGLYMYGGYYDPHSLYGF